MNDLMYALDERLFELGGKMEYARIDFRPGVGPEGTVAWYRTTTPTGRHYVSHRVYFRGEGDETTASLEGGRYDFETAEEAIDDAKERAR